MCSISNIHDTYIHMNNTTQCMGHRPIHSIPPVVFFVVIYFTVPFLISSSGFFD